ncbi:MAG: ZIP family metal transporter [Treponemataceae bacterium]
MNLLQQIQFALAGTGFTFFMTVLGAAVVFCFRKNMSMTVNKIFLGFAAGIMIAASVWSLLIPAINMAREQGQPISLAVGLGFILGGAFLLLLDRLIPHLHVVTNEKEGITSNLRRTFLIVFAVTLHNIPEGMAVGLAFSLAAQSINPSQAISIFDMSTVTPQLASAIALAIGMGLQNFPEGAAISLPLLKEGYSRKKSFFLGGMSGIVEPIFGILTVLIAGHIAVLIPWVLAFAAGAMIYVVVEELIPEAQLGTHSHAGTLSVMAGFLIMMMLDVLLS